MPGTEALGEHLQAKFGGSYGGYSCRPNTADGSKQSVHGTGRAIDFFPNNKAEGDAIANLCVSNHAKWGIQLVIWWYRDWFCDQGWTSYGGPVPHTDHLHIELTVPAAQNNTINTYRGGGLFTVDEVREIKASVARQGRLTRETVVTQGRLTREFVSNLFEKAAEQERNLSIKEIREIRVKVEHESDEILAAIDAVDPDNDQSPVVS
jgi:hypothetical protein